ncbi:Multicopper oxidase, type 3 [Lasallia pustulata]|uniref:Multicopper oxidase, type 3 n=1 Tax=Lasallia pustulata TaxID=136370 RepID=A0A1W5DCP4_9LECA|nr:Multicopper oxidase, type 3 [Lasallia pustulata]
MGFFKTCLELLAYFGAFGQLGDRHDALQIPLHDHSLVSEVTKSPYDYTIEKQPLWSQYNIHTDYEKVIPEGIEREYWLYVQDLEIAPDGFRRPRGKVFNGTYPGPLIEACWGDTITIHVTNRLTDNGTTVHWHGIRQLHTNEMDGVNGVTQCPIAGRSTFTYKFRATQYGHTWYHRQVQKYISYTILFLLTFMQHSHYSLQYPDGVAGPLLIHGPTSANYDVEWDPILISDWSHISAFAEFHNELVGPLPQMQSILLNGTGKYICDAFEAANNCTGGGYKFNRTVTAKTRYLWHLINTSTETTFIFSIDNHELEVISTDFVPIHPYNTTSLRIGIGQRYDVIVTMNAPERSPRASNQSYWIRTVPAKNCGTFQQNQNETRTGIIYYEGYPRSTPVSTAQTFSNNCTDEPYESLVPIVEWAVGQHPANDPSKDTYEAGLSPAPNSTFTEPHGNVSRWEFTDTPLWLNFSNPTFLHLGDKAAWPAEYCVIDEDYVDDWVYIIVTGTAIQSLPNRKRPIAAAHPIHLHGHDFAIIGQSSNPFNETSSPSTFKYHNPPRRDVALLPAGGYLALAFRSDNPGVWLLHCHIAWHASSGLAMQILERQSDIYGSLNPNALSKIRQHCHEWDEWNLQFLQDDSGI